jgi:short-subunit dehydrogenase
VTADFTAKYGPWAVVAGASEGIGAAFSRQLAAKGLKLILIARRAEPLDALATELRAGGCDVVVWAADLGDAGIEAEARRLVVEHEIGLVVLNACASQTGPFLDLDLRGKLATLDVNCRAPLILTSVFGEAMRARGRGGIVFMSSLTGFQGLALLSTYAATKAFCTVLAEGLWDELGAHGVDVLCNVAGATLTPNFEKQIAAERRSSAMPMTPAAVAAEALAALGRRPLHVAGRRNRVVHFVMSRLFSRRRAVRFFGSATRRLYGL